MRVGFAQTPYVCVGLAGRSYMLLCRAYAFPRRLRGAYAFLCRVCALLCRDDGFLSMAV